MNGHTKDVAVEMVLPQVESQDLAVSISIVAMTTGRPAIARYPLGMS